MPGHCSATRSNPRCGKTTGRGPRSPRRTGWTPRPRRRAPRRDAGVTWFGVLIALAVLALAILALWLWTRRRRRKRREAEFAAAQRVDPSDPNALAAVPIDALDDLSKAIVVDVDNAVRTSDSELALAVEEFGAAQTDTFSRAVTNAKTTLAQAFNVRQILDDAVPESIAAAPRPAHPRGGRRRQGRSGTGRANGGVRQTARSGHQRALATGCADPADGRPHRPPRPVGAGAGGAAQPIRRCRTDFGRRQCEDRQAAVGVRRSEHQHRARHSSLARWASRWVWWMRSAPRNPRWDRRVRCSMRSTAPASTSTAPSRHCPTAITDIQNGINQANGQLQQGQDHPRERADARHATRRRPPSPTLRRTAAPTLSARSRA